MMQCPELFFEVAGFGSPGHLLETLQCDLLFNNTEKKLPYLTLVTFINFHIWKLILNLVYANLVVAKVISFRLRT